MQICIGASTPNRNEVEIKMNLKNDGRKILALDLDGTLTNRDKRITPRTKAALMHAQRKGHIVVLASGRPTPGVIPVAKELELEKYGGFMLSYNGARLTNCRTGKNVSNRTFPKELVPMLFEEAEKLHIGIMTYQNFGIVAGSVQDSYMDLEAAINHLTIHHFADPLQKITEPVNKCLGTAPPEYAEELETYFAEKYGNRISVGRSEPFFMEFLPKGVDKAGGLSTLCAHLGMTKESVIACGDGFNDVSMIAYAGLGIAMANAQEPVKEAADYITYSNDEDGIANVVERFVS